MSVQDLDNRRAAFMEKLAAFYFADDNLSGVDRMEEIIVRLSALQKFFFDGLLAFADGTPYATNAEMLRQVSATTLRDVIKHLVNMHMSNE